MHCEVDIVIGSEYIKSPTTLALSIAFENGGTEQSVTFTPKNGRSLMTLKNWSNPLGSALISPYELAQINQEGIVDLLMSNQFIGGTNQLTLQLWWKKIN
jgi:hypothetical protein